MSRVYPFTMEEAKAILADFGESPGPAADAVPAPVADEDTAAALPDPTKDLAHAEVLAVLYRDRLRYVPRWGRWLRWTGARWTETSEEEVATDAAAALRREYGRRIARAATRDEIDRWTRLAAETCVHARIRGGLAFLAGWPGFATDVEALDAHPWLLNLGNGVLDLRTGTLERHDPGLLLTRCARAEWDERAEAPQWREHLELCLPDPDVRRQVQRDLGVGLVGEQIEERLAIWWGTGRNGKSTTCNVLLELLGDYGGRTAPNLLIARRHEEHPTCLADLFGRRLVFSVEPAPAAKLDEQLVKELTGGDRIKARRMREDYWEFKPSHSLVLVTNHKPRVWGQDEAIWRRLSLVPWVVAVPTDRQRDQAEVVRCLLAEAPGILRWIVQGLQDRRHEPRWVAPAVAEASAQYRAEQDALGGFIEECCELAPRFRVPARGLYEAYERWCQEAGEDPLKHKSFSQLLSTRGIHADKAARGRREYRGIRLRAEAGKTF